MAKKKPYEGADRITGSEISEASQDRADLVVLSAKKISKSCPMNPVIVPDPRRDAWSPDPPG